MNLETDSTTHESLRCDCGLLAEPKAKRFKPKTASKYDLFDKDSEEEIQALNNLNSWEHFKKSLISEYMPNVSNLIQWITKLIGTSFQQIFSSSAEQITFAFRKFFEKPTIEKENTSQAK